MANLLFSDETNLPDDIDSIHFSWAGQRRGETFLFNDRFEVPPGTRAMSKIWGHEPAGSLCLGAARTVGIDGCVSYSLMWDFPYSSGTTNSDEGKQARRKRGERAVALGANQAYGARGGRNLFDRLYRDEDRPDGRDERPDLMGRIKGCDVGIEVSALALEDRRAAHRAADTIRRELSATGAEAPRLAGCTVFLSPRNPEIQPKTSFGPEAKHFRALAKAILDAEVNVRVPDGADVMSMSDVPPQFLYEDVGNGWQLLAYPQAAPFRETDFKRSFGFEVVVKFTTVFGPEEAWHLVQRTLDEHTGYKAQVFLATVGAPDPLTGYVYPAEVLLFEAMRLALPRTPLRSAWFDRVVVYGAQQGMTLVAPIERP